jgi:aminopeptidase N
MNRRRPSSVTAALLLALLFLLSSSPAPSQVPAAAQPAAPAYQWPRSHDYHVQHYRIAIAFDWARKSISGETTMDIRPFKSGLKEVEVDAGEMQIDSVRLGGGAALKFRYENNEKLFVQLDQQYPAGRELAITIKYSATPKKGLTFITPTSSEPNRPYQIWSQGEAQTNHYWFPCYDYPNDKAASDIFVTVEDKYKVISNGQLVGVQPDSARKMKTWHWKMDKPFSSYLASVIVGEFAEIKDQFKTKPVISYVYPDQVEDGRISLGKIAQMIAFFSEKIGVDYPYPKYAETTVRDFPGGMENISATTMTDTTIHDKRAALDVSSDGLISHELAHQWFGDLLTCRDWGEIWLNESFAEFFATLWEEHDKSKDDYLYTMRAYQQQYIQTWFRGERRPVVTERYDDPDALFDIYAYAHGATVINMLRFVLGEELFWKAINHYVDRFQWQNVDTARLIDAVEEATGQNLQWFFDEWLYKMGHPEFEISSNYDEGSKTLKLTVKQTQKPDDKRPWFGSPEYFTMPVDIAVTTSSGEKINRVRIDRREQDFSFQLDSKPLIINFDRGNYLIKQVKFNRSDADLAYQLLHDSDTTGRLRAIADIKASHSDTGLKALAEAALRDQFWGVRSDAVRTLSEFKNDASKAALVEAAKDKDSHVRRAAIDGLGAFKDPALADLFIKVINTDPSYFAVSDAARALGQTGSPRAYDALMEMLKQDSWHDTIRGGSMAGLAALKDPRALEIALRYAAPGHGASLRAAAYAVLGESGKGNEQAFKLLTDALKSEGLTFELDIAALQALAALGDPRAIPVLEEFQKRPDLPGPARPFIQGFITRLKNSTKGAATKD